MLTGKNKKLYGTGYVFEKKSLGQDIEVNRLQTPLKSKTVKGVETYLSFPINSFMMNQTLNSLFRPRIAI